MDFRSLIQSLDTINEDSKVHKGTYGNSYGKEDVRDQYGHKVGKVNKDTEGKKEAPKKGRGRPKKGADDSGEVKKYDTATLGSVFGGGKKPSKEVGKTSVKHSLKEYIEEAELALNEDASLGVKPLPGASEITMNNQPTGITAKDQQSATKIKDLMATGDISLPGAGDGADTGVNTSLGEDEFDDEEHGSHDPAEYGMEGDYVKNQLHTIARVTSHLEEKLSDNEDLPEWVQEKVSQAKGMMVGVMDYIASEKERDVERETGQEEMVSEKAKSKAQQRFFGMVHSMQKGKKVPGASSELKGVAKDIGKSDAKDFAKTKHKGLPDHVGENKPHPKELEMIGKTREMGVQNRARDAEQRMAARAAEPKNIMQKVKQDIGGPLSKLAKGDVKGAFFEQGVSEGFPAYAKGNAKFGKDGMKKLRDKEAAGASKKEMQATRDEFNKYKKTEVDEAKDLPGKQDKLDVAEPKGKLTKADFEALRSKKKVKESTDMKITQLTEGAMKDLLINFYSDVESHKGDGSVFDLKRARNVQQAEEILKALVKHGDEYDGLDNSSQNELVNQTLKYLAHEKELPFNTLDNTDKQRFTTRTPNDLSSYRQNPGAKPGSDFSKPGSPMAVPRTSTTGSNGFLKTLSTPQTFNEGNDMKDKQFESWERELNSLLTEGITVSHSTGQQGSPDSLSINATEHDAGELMSILRNSGMGMFGGSKEQNGGYGAPEQGGKEGEDEFHQGIEIAPSPEVVGDGDDMLALIKKMSGIDTDPNTPKSVEIDYEDEEEGDKSHDDEESHDEESDEEEISELTAEYPGGSTPLPEGDEEEISELTAEYPGGSTDFNTGTVKTTGGTNEGEMEEGNAFTDKLRKTPKGGEFKMGDKSYKDTSSIEEGQEDCNECGYPMESCGCEHVEEGYSNDAGGDAMGDTELTQLKELLSMGNDLHRVKRTQSTGNIQKVTMETKLLKDTTELLTDWKKLSGIK